jgi:hypothetical protein
LAARQAQGKTRLLKQSYDVAMVALQGPQKNSEIAHESPRDFFHHEEILNRK